MDDTPALFEESRQVQAQADAFHVMQNTLTFLCGRMALMLENSSTKSKRPANASWKLSSELTHAQGSRCSHAAG
jgi:hypothetical protein